MTPVLVLGYGNPMRRDDGAGWEAARILSRENLGEEVCVMAFRQLTPDLAEPVSRYRNVIFLDAGVDEGPGCISTRRIQAAPGGETSLSHEIDPRALLGWARELYRAEPRATLVTMGAGSFELGEGFSQEVERAFPEFLARIRDEITAA
jgi:hydrogenase maturation protease